MSTSTELLLASSPATYTEDVSGSRRAWPAPQQSVSDGSVGGHTAPERQHLGGCRNSAISSQLHSSLLVITILKRRAS